MGEFSRDEPKASRSTLGSCGLSSKLNHHAFPDFATTTYPNPFSLTENEMISSLIQSLLESYFRVEDFPDVGGTFTDRYEVLRRALVNLNAQTIFGPVQFNEFQRNNGRGAAGTMAAAGGTTAAGGAAGAAA